MRGRWFVCASLLLAASACAEAAPRVWTDSTGKFTIEAEFVGFEDGKVKLKKASGEEIALPMTKLSAGDQKFVRDLLRAKREGGPVAATSAAPGKLAEGGLTGEWPQWRGPNRDGVSLETGLLSKWPEGGPKLLWSAKNLGGGFSSVAIAGGKIYTLGNRRGGTELICLAEQDGAELWATRVGGGEPNCTPTVTSDLVYALGREGDLLAARVADGGEAWRKNFGRDFGGKMESGWGYSESPLIDGDRLVCTPGGPKALLAALNKTTGEVEWTTEAPAGRARGNDGAGYSSIVISRAGGVKQYIQLTGHGVVGVDAEKGVALWRYDRVANGTANIPTPLTRDNLVFCSTGYGDGGSALLEVSSRGGAVGFNEIYYRSNNEAQNHHGGMILLGDHVYMGHGHNNGFPLCLNLKTGKDAWRPGRGPGTGSAAICYADGHLYFRYQNGVMALIEATPEAYRLKGEFKIATVKRESWPHPAIANKKLYLRDQDTLHCYDIARN